MIKLKNLLAEEIYGNVAKMYHFTKSNDLVSDIVRSKQIFTNDNLFGTGIYGYIYPNNRGYKGNLIRTELFVTIKDFLILEYAEFKKAKQHVRIVEEFNKSKSNKYNFIELQVNYFGIDLNRIYTIGQYGKNSLEPNMYSSPFSDTTNRIYDLIIKALGGRKVPFKGMIYSYQGSNVDINNVADRATPVIVVYDTKLVVPIKSIDLTTGKTITYKSITLDSPKFVEQLKDFMSDYITYKLDNIHNVNHDKDVYGKFQNLFNKIYYDEKNDMYLFPENNKFLESKKDLIINELINNSDHYEFENNPNFKYINNYVKYIDGEMYSTNDDDDVPSVVLELLQLLTINNKLICNINLDFFEKLMSKSEKNPICKKITKYIRDHSDQPDLQIMSKYYNLRDTVNDINALIKIMEYDTNNIKSIFFRDIRGENFKNIIINSKLINSLPTNLKEEYILAKFPFIISDNYSKNKKILLNLKVSDNIIDELKQSLFNYRDSMFPVINGIMVLQEDLSQYDTANILSQFQISGIPLIKLQKSQLNMYPPLDVKFIKKYKFELV